MYNLIHNNSGEGCSFGDGVSNWSRYGNQVLSLSLGNRKRDSSLTVSGILNVAFVAVGAVVSLIYRRIQVKTIREVDIGAVTAADYTVKVQGIPTGESVEDIKKFFETSGGKKGEVHVKKIVPAYDIGAYISLLRKNNRMLLKKAKGKAEKGSEAKLAEIQTELKVLEQEFARKDSHRFTGIAFITFATEAGKYI